MATTFAVAFRVLTSLCFFCSFYRLWVMVGAVSFATHSLVPLGNNILCAQCVKFHLTKSILCNYCRKHCSYPSLTVPSALTCQATLHWCLLPLQPKEPMGKKFGAQSRKLCDKTQVRIGSGV